MLLDELLRVDDVELLLGAAAEVLDALVAGVCDGDGDGEPCVLLFDALLVDDELVDEVLAGRLGVTSKLALAWMTCEPSCCWATTKLAPAGVPPGTVKVVLKEPSLATCTPWRTGTPLNSMSTAPQGFVAQKPVPVATTVVPGGPEDGSRERWGPAAPAWIVTPRPQAPARVAAMTSRAARWRDTRRMVLT